MYTRANGPELRKSASGRSFKEFDIAGRPLWWRYFTVAYFKPNCASPTKISFWKVALMFAPNERDPGHVTIAEWVLADRVTGREGPRISDVALDLNDRHPSFMLENFSASTSHFEATFLASTFEGRFVRTGSKSCQQEKTNRKIKKFSHAALLWLYKSRRHN
jgi:hypothetical protein